MWNTPGGEDNLSRAEYLRYMRKGDRVPDTRPPSRCNGLIQYYNSARSFAGVIDNPLTMSVIEEWQRHTYVVLDRWERECLFAMDRALRRSYSDVLQYHASRKQVKTLVGGGKDKDWKRAYG